MLNKFLQFAALSAALSLPMTASAQVRVSDPWVRGTVAAQTATGAFMSLTAEADLRLIAAASPAAGVVEIHEMAMDSGVMKMRRVPSVALPAGQAVVLKPGGYHVMLMDLKRPLATGDLVPLTLTLEKSGGQRLTVEVQAQVRALAGSDAGHGGHGKARH